MSYILGGALSAGALYFIFGSNRRPFYKIERLSKDAELQSGVLKILTDEWPSRKLMNNADLVQLVAVLLEDPKAVIGFVQVGPGRYMSKERLMKYVSLNMKKKVIENKMAQLGLDPALLDNLEDLDEQLVWRSSAYLGPIVVDPRFRRKGIASALLAACVSESQLAYKATSIYGMCLNHLIPFYKKVGACRMENNSAGYVTMMIRDLDASALAMAKEYLCDKRITPINGHEFVPEDKPSISK